MKSIEKHKIDIMIRNNEIRFIITHLIGLSITTNLLDHIEIIELNESFLYFLGVNKPNRQIEIGTEYLYLR